MIVVVAPCGASLSLSLCCMRCYVVVIVLCVVLGCHLYTMWGVVVVVVALCAVLWLLHHVGCCGHCSACVMLQAGHKIV
jgi:hypothetical protein